MKNSFKAIVMTLALTATIRTASAASELVSLSVTPLWPTNSQPGNVVLYQVTVERAGQGLLEVNLCSGGLPGNCTSAFGKEIVRYTGRNPKRTQFIMAVTGDCPTPTDKYPFTVTGTAKREEISVTNNVAGDNAESLVTEPPAVPSMVGVLVRENGDAEVRGFGKTAESYQIEATTDVSNPTWTEVGSCTADGNGRFTFIHSGAQANTGMRFYRAVKSAPAE